MIESERVPAEMLAPTSPAGEIRELFYEFEGERKRALVYLPAAAKASPEKRFPTVCLCHGGGGSEDDFFGGVEGKSGLTHVLDNLINEGKLSPVLVVTPTYYHRGTENALVHAGAAMTLTETFYREFEAAVIPAVEAAFPAIPDRDHRVVGGFSMGAEATWSTLAYGGRAARYYLPMSGDFWAVAVKGGENHTDETCCVLIEAMEKAGLEPGSFTVFAATGMHDIAYPAMRPMVEELLRRAPWFTPENLIWCVSDGWHAYDWCRDYIAQALPVFFPGKA